MENTLLKVKEKLRFIQTNGKEVNLFPYLQQLFVKKGLQKVEITHGKDEYGKDLVFSQYDDILAIERYTAVVVKNKDAGMKDFEAAGEIQRQIDLCFKMPYVDGLGKQHHINSVIVVINGSISPQAKVVLKETIPSHFLTNINEWNYQRIAQEFSEFISPLFLSHTDPNVNVFLKNQEELLIHFNGASEIYQGLSVKDVNDIYVNVRTTIRKHNIEKKAYAEYDKSSKLNRFEDPDDSIEIVNANNSYIIHGIPTSGKSLLLKRIGYNSIYHYKGKPIAPFYFEVCRMEDLSSIDMWEYIKKDYEKKANGIELKVDEYSKICLLIDGIDEISDIAKRVEYLEKLHSFADEFKANYKTTILQLVISTREIEVFDSNSLMSDYERIELLPFDVGQAFSLVKKLIPGNKGKAESFLKAIRDTQLSNSLTRTPMALSLMAILYREEKIDLDELPANITELYNKFTDYYLNRWDASKGISSQYKYEESKHILALIAKHMHTKGKPYISSKELSDELASIKANYGYEELKDVDTFINTLIERSGIIRYDERKQTFSFSHLAFQEYFVSIAYDDSEEDDFIKNFFDNWWANTIIFYCGRQPKRDVLLKKIIKDVVPYNAIQQSTFLHLLSKTFQASYLIHNDTKRVIIERLVDGFDLFYRKLLEFEPQQNFGLLYQLTTLDFIIELRRVFGRIIGSKHFNQTLVKEVLEQKLMQGIEKYTDISLYAIAFYLSGTTKSTSYLEAFIELDGLDERWQRIVYVDITRLKNRTHYDEKLFRKIKKRQLKYRIYIQKQFRESAFIQLLNEIK